MVQELQLPWWQWNLLFCRSHVDSEWFRTEVLFKGESSIVGHAALQLYDMDNCCICMLDTIRVMVPKKYEKNIKKWRDHCGPMFDFQVYSEDMFELEKFNCLKMAISRGPYLWISEEAGKACETRIIEYHDTTLEEQGFAVVGAIPKSHGKCQNM